MANQLTGKQAMSPSALETKHTFNITREQEEEKGNAFCGGSLRQRRALKSSPIALGCSQHTLFIPVLSTLGSSCNRSYSCGHPSLGRTARSRPIILSSITIKDFTSGVRKLTPTLSSTDASRRHKGEHLVKLAEVPGLSRMSDAVLAEIFTCSTILLCQQQASKSPVQEKGKLLFYRV